jgi:hypothetical protein
LPHKKPSNDIIITGQKGPYGAPCQIIFNGKKRTIKGYCSRCGACCEVYKAGKPCEHLKYEMVDGKRVAYCNPETLFGGYFGRFLGCALYPLMDDPEDILPGCTFEVEVEDID